MDQDCHTDVQQAMFLLRRDSNPEPSTCLVFLCRPLRLSADAGAGRHLLRDEEHGLEGLQPLLKCHH